MPSVIKIPKELADELDRLAEAEHMALANQVPLLTDNRKHFPMSELKLFPLPE